MAEESKGAGAGAGAGASDLFSKVKTSRVLCSIDFGTSRSGVAIMDLTQDNVATMRRAGVLAATSGEYIGVRFGEHPEGVEHAPNPVKFPTQVTSVNDTPVYMGNKEDVSDDDVVQIFRYFKMCLSPDRKLEGKKEEEEEGARRTANAVGTAADGYPRARRTNSSTYENMMAWPLDSDKGEGSTPVPLRSLITLCLSRLKHTAVAAARKHVVDELGQAPLEMSDIFWVITIPSIWDNWANDFMRQAAIEAGLFAPALDWTDADMLASRGVSEYQVAAKERLRFVHEPVAAAVACLTPMWNPAAAKLGLEVGDSFVVLDCGGGTTDIAVLTIEKVHPLEVNRTKSIGIPAGADRIDTALKQVIEEQLLIEPLSGGELSSVLEKWVDAKHTYAGGEFSRFDVDSAIFAKFRREGIPGKITLHNRRSKLKLTKAFMEELFRPLINDIMSAFVSAVGSTHSAELTEATKSIKAVALVGGFGSSPCMKTGLQAVVNRAYPHMKVLTPTDPHTAILKGAALMGTQLSGAFARAGLPGQPKLTSFTQPCSIGVTCLEHKQYGRLPAGLVVPDHGFSGADHRVRDHMSRRLQRMFTDVTMFYNERHRPAPRPAKPMRDGWWVKMLEVALSKGLTFRGTEYRTTRSYRPITMEQDRLVLDIMQLGRAKGTHGTFAGDAQLIATVEVKFPSGKGYTFTTKDDKSVEVVFQVDSEGILDVRVKCLKYPELSDRAPKIVYANLDKRSNTEIANHELATEMETLGLRVGAGHTLDDAKAAWRAKDRSKPEVNLAMERILTMADQDKLGDSTIASHVFKLTDDIDGEL